MSEAERTKPITDQLSDIRHDVKNLEQKFHLVSVETTETHDLVKEIRAVIVGNKDFKIKGISEMQSDHETRILRIEKKLDRVWWVAIGAIVPFTMGMMEIVTWIKELITK